MSNVTGKGRRASNAGLSAMGGGGSGASLVAPGGKPSGGPSFSGLNYQDSSIGGGVRPQISSLFGQNKGPDPCIKITEQIELVFQDERDIERDILKEVLEAIVTQLRANSDNTLKVETKLASKYMIFEK